MTPEQLLAMPAGRDLDAAVHRALGLPPLCRHERDGYGKCARCGLHNSHWKRISPPEPYSTHLAAAWLVFQAMHAKLFSHRRAFLGALQKVVSDGKVEGGSLIAWPDAFWFVTPEAICKAALLTLTVHKRGEECPQSNPTPA